MPTIEKTVPVKMNITPQELAKLFWEEMNADSQAVFFNHLHTMAVTDGEQGLYLFQMQMQYLTDTEILDKGGRTIMEIIGNYASNPAASS